MPPLMRADVVIVGGGAAGLSAARVLADAGRSVLILEARNRLGGRIFTIPDERIKTPIELGAEFVHGRPPATWRLIRESGLTALDLPFDHMRYQHGRLVDVPDIDTELNKVMSGLAHLGRHDKSFAQYLDDRSSKSSPQARKFAISFVEGFDAADPRRISAQSIAAEHEGIGDVENQTQFRLLQGYGALVDFLRRQLDPKRVRIRLGFAVSEIRWEKSKVQFRSAAGRETARGRRALISLPLGVLQIPPQVHGAVRFDPDIAQWRATSMLLASGPVVKAILRFREPFWEDERASRDAVFLHNPSAPFPAFWTMRPLRLPLITAWAGGPKAQALAGSSRRELLRAAIESLAQMLGHRPRQLAKLIDQFHFHDWGSDPHSRGAYSYVTVDGMGARAKLIKPIENTLFFAGEALDTSGQASTVGGALASGQRAAEQLLSAWKV
jgi:monoamine oxidase